MPDGATQVLLPQGFRFAAGYAGIRKAEQDDLALIVSDREASAAGVFTRNMVRAAPVTVTAQALRSSGGTGRVIVANAGNANCATPNMAAVSAATVKAVSKLAAVPRDQVLIASTGVIGEPMSETAIPKALGRLCENLTRDQFEACARAIMTTDTVAKVAYAPAFDNGDTFRIAGMAKGAGMIMPDMATMLSFVVTDAEVEPALLAELLRKSVDCTFNCITVDSDTSTNDTVLVLANGASGHRVERGSEGEFYDRLVAVNTELAKAIVRDGEGATRIAEVNVLGAPSDATAKRLAMAIANSPLVKTALAGADPNWGRILGAAGKCGVQFDLRKVEVSLAGTLVCANGSRAQFDEGPVQKAMLLDTVPIEFRILGSDSGSARVWTCDFTDEYIRINADYRT